MLVLVAVVAAAQSVPNGDFENGTFDPWTVVLGPPGVLALYESDQQPIWTIEVDRRGGRAVVCSASFSVTRDRIAAQMVTPDDQSGTTDWWVETPAGAELASDDESPDDAGQGWSDHNLSVGAACGEEVLLCVEPGPNDFVYYDDFVLVGAACPGYTDGDGDGYCTIGVDTDGDGECTDDAEFAGPSDCNDAEPGVNPGLPEVCNGRDDDCNGIVDDGFDVDGDTYTCDDCDDRNADRNPGAPEVCNFVDDDCNGAIDEGYDLDADLVTTCAGDCEDTVATTFPGAVEQCNGVDDDCNLLVDDEVEIVEWWPDGDGDGYGDAQARAIEDCAADPGYVPDGTDCDDGNPEVYPGADDPPRDGLDANCDGGDGDVPEPEDPGEPVPGTDGGRGPAAPDPSASTEVGCGCGGGVPTRGGLVVAGIVLVRRRLARRWGGR